MRRLIAWCVAAALVPIALSGCGGGNDGGGLATPAPAALPSTGTALSQAIASAAANPANDTSANSSSAFKVLQDSGVAAVTVAGAPVVNFTVFSDGAVKQGLTLSNVSFAIAKLVPGPNGEIDRWESYVYRTETTTGSNAVGSGPGGTPVLASADPGIDRSQADRAGQSARLQSQRLLHVHVQHRHHRSEQDQWRLFRAEPHAPHRDPAQLHQRCRRDRPRQSVFRCHFRRQRQVRGGDRSEPDPGHGRREFMQRLS